MLLTVMQTANTKPTLVSAGLRRGGAWRRAKLFAWMVDASGATHSSTSHCAPPTRRPDVLTHVLRCTIASTSSHSFVVASRAAAASRASARRQ
jgi:hypothetical protein